MSMFIKFLQKHIVFVITAFALTFACVNRVSFAEEMSMDVFQAKFQESTGKTWENADPREKRNFVRTYQKTTAKELPTNGAEVSVSAPTDTSSSLKRTVNVEVRKKFAAQYQKNWDDGTPEEQESFLQEYKTLKQNEAESERQKKLAEEEGRRAAEQATQEKRRAEQQRKEEAARITQEKKRAEEQEVTDQRQRLKAKQEEMKVRRSRSR